MRMATIYIHIGTHKTGTKSIQHTFFDSRKELLRRGINYLPIAVNHSTHLFSLFADKPHKYHANMRLGVDTEEKAARHNAKLREEVEGELRANRSPKLIVSGEDLSSLKPHGVAALKELLDPFANGYRVIVYVRSPSSYALSAIQERLKHGYTLEAIQHEPHAPRYRFRIEKFMQAFGRENVVIRIFEATRFPGGSLIADFCTAIDEPAELAGALDERRANESLSTEAALLLNELNKAKPMFLDGRVNRDRAPNVIDYLTDVKGAKFSMPAEFLRRTEEAAQGDLAWLRGALSANPFPEPARREEAAPLWSETALQSLALKLNQLARLEQGGSFERAALERIAALETGFSRAAQRLSKAAGWRPDEAAADGEPETASAEAEGHDVATGTNGTGERGPERTGQRTWLQRAATFAGGGWRSAKG
jgi:hypothetical protein